MTTSNQKIFNLENRVTDYICPQLVQVYNQSELTAIDIPSTEFLDDIKSVIMFRGLESDEPNGLQTFKKYKKYGIAINDKTFEPDRDVTRAEFVKMLVRSLSCRYQYM